MTEYWRGNILLCSFAVKHLNIIICNIPLKEKEHVTLYAPI